MALDQPLQLPPWVTCLHCSAPLPINDQITASYFSGNEHSCQKCTKPIDWWDTILTTIQSDFGFTQALAPVGARWTIFHFTLRPNIRSEIKIEDQGIPIDAKGLGINYTSQMGGLFPLEIHSNTPHRHIISSTLRLYPMPFGDGPHEEAKVNVLVTWVPHTSADEAWRNLIDA